MYCNTQIYSIVSIRNSPTYYKPACMHACIACVVHARNYKVFADFPTENTDAAKAYWITGDSAELALLTRNNWRSYISMPFIVFTLVHAACAPFISANAIQSSCTAFVTHYTVRLQAFVHVHVKAWGSMFAQRIHMHNRAIRSTHSSNRAKSGIIKV